MGCAHDGFYRVSTKYDDEQGVIVYFWICETCDERLDVARTEPYRPQYNPHGNDAYLPPALAARQSRTPL